jgi:hypothetical protein
MELVSSGIQGKIINGDPSYSHFLFSFNRHSKFAFDTLQIPFSDHHYGRELSCFIPVDSGDLITKLTLRVDIDYNHTGLPPRPNYGGRPVIKEIVDEATYYWSTGSSIHILDYAELYIGGMLIQRITPEWININSKITHERTQDISMGISINPRRIGNDLRYDGTDNEPSIYIDLDFHSPILACKLKKHNCRVKIKFKDFKDVFITPLRGKMGGSFDDYIAHWYKRLTDPNYDGFSPSRDRLTPGEEADFYNITKNFKFKNVTLLCEYGYLSEHELGYLNSRPIEQLITQVQLKRFNVPQGGTERVRLNFKNPVKSLYFFVGEGRDTNIFFTNAKLFFNNETVFDEDPYTLIYHNSKKNTLCGIHVGFKGKPSHNGPTEKLDIGSYSFALYPLDDKPTGHVNFSRIINQEFEITIPTTDPFVGHSSLVKDINECQVYAVSYNILAYSSGLGGLKF